MISADTRKKVDAYWASYFGVSVADFTGSRTLAVRHNELAGFDGALVFRHGSACVVSVPDSTPEIERSKLRAASPAEVFDPKFLAKVFVISTDKVHGPAWIGIADRGDFKSAKSTARILGDADEPAIEKLAEGCGELDWKHSKLIQVRKPLFGLFVGQDLVAVSGYVVLGNVLAYIGVITHPAHRGKGYAKAVVSSAVADVFSKGYAAQWRTLESNEGAIALAKTMGFQPYASTYDVELVETEF